MSSSGSESNARLTMAEMQETIKETYDLLANTDTYTNNTSEWIRKGWDKE